MNARSLISLTLLAGIAFGAWWLWSTGPGSEGDALSGGVFPDTSTMQDGPTAGDLPPEPAGSSEGRLVAEREDRGSRVAAASGEGSRSIAPAVPDDALWVDCRLLLPEGMPPDEELFVEARGRAFESGALEGERRFRTRVEGAGQFQVAFAAGTRRGRLALEGRYYYLDGTVRVDVDEAESSEVVIEPRLGGLVRGRVLPPATSSLEEVDLSEVKIACNATGSGIYNVRRVDVDSEGRFELPAVVPGAYLVEAESPRFVDIGQDVLVVAGEAAEVELMLTPGIQVRGRVVGVDGQGIPEPAVTVHSSDRSHGDRMHFARTLPSESDGEGYFECLGVPPGEIVVEGGREGYLTTRVELGEQVDGAVIDDLRIELDEGLAIEGLVRWPDGTPAAGAEVRVTELEARQSQLVFRPESPSSRTDAGGRFRFGGLREGALKVTASAEHFEPPREGGTGEAPSGSRWTAELTEVPAGTSGLVLVLDPGLSLAGRVVDDTGVPMSSFWIRAVPDRGDIFSGIGGFSEDAVSERFRSEDGRFALEGLSPGDWRISASARRHANSALYPLSVPYQGPALELVVARQATIRGEVVDPGGVPVVDAKVELKAERAPAAIVILGAAAAARTDEEGIFELKRVDPGAVTLVASAEGLGASDPLPVQVRPGAELEGLRLVLRVAARILGRIDPATGSVAGRRIHVRRASGGFTETILSDAAGEFAIEGLTRDVYVLTLEPEGEAPEDEAGMLRYYSSMLEERVELAEGETKHVVLGAPPDHPIEVRGRVTSAGEPQAGQLLTCLRADESGASGRAAAHCDDAGRFSLTLDGPGEYNFSFGNEWGDQITIARTVPDREVVTIDFELPSGHVAGRVSIPGGAPAHSCPVTLERTAVPDGAAESWGVSQFQSTGADGTFRFERLPPGTYLLRVGGSLQWQLQNTDQLYGLQRLDDLRLAPGESLDDLKIELRPAGSIEGLVLAPDGSPAAGAAILLVNDDSDYSAWSAPRTSAQGRFRYRGLGEGRVEIQARLGKLASEPKEVRVVEGGSVEVVLQLEE